MKEGLGVLFYLLVNKEEKEHTGLFFPKHSSSSLMLEIILDFLSSFLPYLSRRK
jgi:hypothetical protein